MKNEYLTYDALQMAGESSFIKWVKEAGSPDASRWEAWVEAHPAMEPVIREARVLVEANLETLVPVRHDIDTAALWQKIDSSISTENAKASASGKVRRLRPLYWAASIAAALLLLFLIFQQSPTETQLKSLAGQHVSYTLPDSSNIELNAASTVRFNQKKFTQNREVFLQGEAFFEVEKGTDFVVRTQAGAVRVLGTSFNVFERAGAFEVQCLTGKVEVSLPAGQGSVILLPGEVAIRKEEGRLEKEAADKTNLATWRVGKFRYKDEPLADALDELKRQYNVEIDYRAQDLMRACTCSFEDKDLNQALEDILFIHGLTYELKGKTVVIREEE